MKKRKKLKRIILRSKQKGWADCADVMKKEIESQVDRQKYLDSIKYEALNREVERLMQENKKLKKEYSKFVELKNTLMYQSRKMNEATSSLNKDIMLIIQRFLKIADSSERIEAKHNKIEQKLKRMVR